MNNGRYTPGSKPETIPALVPCNEAMHRASGPESAVNEQAGKAPTVSQSSSPQSLRAWRRRNGGFIAGECGVAFEPQEVSYHQRIPGPKAEFQSRPLTQGDVEASEEFLQELIAAPDIDPESEEDVVIRGERLSAYKASLLQRLGRSFAPAEHAPTDHEARAGRGPGGGVW